MIDGQRLEHKRTRAESKQEKLVAWADAGEKVSHDSADNVQLPIHTAGGIDEDAEGNRYRIRLTEPCDGQRAGRHRSIEVSLSKSDERLAVRSGYRSGELGEAGRRR